MEKFTKESLAKFDGKNGNPAYVAIDGTVYDVTGNSHWTDGEHHGVEAGRDLTEAIAQSPHGKSVLGNLKEVGTYSED
ncbi:cytochrome B5 [Lactobacillus sp. ESL0684]|uniref:cytochrome b5 domain-containing protein n=1 Tax=unclassified Lactobacillus TaxID=2620435 RepID=UPI0023F96099|nr:MULTISPECIES: cytochrome b5 domain-containing protein [unclassified Lactobacillus]WEV39751.1 cytochrome B5 [Lactobacillus sp. ESL0681]WEV43711.1 cytochrome B5 [Lactobacillus sp. ESL0684]